MDSWEVLINRISLDLKDYEETLESERRLLGEHLSSLEEELFKGTDLEKLYREAKTLREKIPRASKVKDRILVTARQRKAVQEKLKRSRERLRKSELERETVYRKIGELAYEQHEKESTKNPEVEKVLAELSAYSEGKKQIDNELERYQRSVSKKGFWKNLVETGRVAYLRVSRSVLQRRLQEMYRRAGAALCTAEIKGLEGTAFADLQRICREKDASCKAALKENEKLLKEEEKIEAELKNLGGGITYQRSVKALEKTIRVDEQRLDEVYRNLGEAYCEKPFKEPDKKTDSIRQKIDDLEKKKSEKNQHIERLRAAIGIKRLADQNAGLSERLAALEKSIEKQQREAERLKGIVAHNNEEIGKLRKVRGQEKTLLQEPEPRKPAK